MRLLILFILLMPQRVMASEIAFVGIDANCYLANLAVNGMTLGSKIIVNSASETTSSTTMMVAVVMVRDIEEYRRAIISQQQKKVYACKGATDDESPKDLVFLFFVKITDYYDHLSKENIQNMARRVIHRHLEPEVVYDEVKGIPQLGINHPSADAPFSCFDDLGDWQREYPGYYLDRLTVGLLFHSIFHSPGQKELSDCLISQIEQSGLNLPPCFGRDRGAIDSFLAADPVNIVYLGIENMLHKLYTDVETGCVEGMVGFHPLLVKQHNFRVEQRHKRSRIISLMFIAEIHVEDDQVGNDDSWSGALEELGIEVSSPMIEYQGESYFKGFPFNQVTPQLFCNRPDRA